MVITSSMIHEDLTLMISCLFCSLDRLLVNAFLLVKKIIIFAKIRILV